MKFWAARCICLLDVPQVSHNIEPSSKRREEEETAEQKG